MHTRSTRRMIALVCALGAVVVACGGDDDDGGGGASSGADTEIGRALAADMLEEGDGSPVQTEEEARCWSGRIVDGIGEDRLQELGVSAQNVGDIEDIDFTEGEISTVVSGLFDCTDVRAAFAREFEADFGEEGAQCVADEMDEELVTSMMTAAFAGADEPPDEFFQAFLDIAAKCDLPLG